MNQTSDTDDASFAPGLSGEFQARFRHFFFMRSAISDQRTLLSSCIDQNGPLASKEFQDLSDVFLNGAAAEFADYYITPLLETGVPHLLTVGNHDIGNGGKKGIYQYLFGEWSLNHCFDLRRVRFQFLDSGSGTVPWREVAAPNSHHSDERIQRVAAHPHRHP